MDEINKYREKWSEEETILVFYYYCQIPFGKIYHSNPEIIRIANLIGRTPGSISFKMGNLGHFDPSLRSRNVLGLSNASKLDEQIVNQFLDNWEDLSFLARQIEKKYLQEKEEKIIEESFDFPNGSEKIVEVKTRVSQQFFRKAVLSSYSQQCCITCMAVPSLLDASHIKPWAKSDPKTERANPSNGLCLNALHHKAFDVGLITVLPDYTIKISSELKKQNLGSLLELLLEYDGQKIILPNKFLPKKEFLEYHNDIIFQK